MSHGITHVKMRGKRELLPLGIEPRILSCRANVCTSDTRYHCATRASRSEIFRLFCYNIIRLIGPLSIVTCPPSPTLLEHWLHPYRPCDAPHSKPPPPEQKNGSPPCAETGTLCLPLLAPWNLVQKHATPTVGARQLCDPRAERGTKSQLNNGADAPRERGMTSTSNSSVRSRQPPPPQKHQR